MAKKSTQSVKQKRASNIRVKEGSEVAVSLQGFLAYNLHSRFNTSLSETTQKQLVTYAPGISIALIIFILPELLILAKDGTLITFTGFFDAILFNQQAWVVLLVVLSGIMLLVDGIGDLFSKKLRGWQRIYIATLINAAYILGQLFSNLSQPAAPIVSLIAIFIILFVQLDIKKYYKP